MAPWIPLTSLDGLSTLTEDSNTNTCIILKHSTTCPISSVAKMRIDDHWDIDDPNLKLYYLDLIAHRSVSNQIADQFEIVHESPQILIIKEGRCVYDVSHMDINMSEIKDGILEN